jgi:hypothetical protein
MTRAARKTLIGKWRIVKMELWNTGYLDLVESASTYGLSVVVRVNSCSEL